MIRTSSLHDACGRLFADYPLAVTAIDRSETVHSMVLMLPDGDGAGYFALTRHRGDGEASYSLWSWPAGDIVEIDTEPSAAVPDVAADVATRGVPIPRDGSLFGWIGGDAVTALIVVYTEYTAESPEPSWTVMPLAGIPEDQWPPFTGEPLFGHWTWDYCQAAKAVSLAALIAANPDTVFWVDTKPLFGSDCCAVARDVADPDGPTLRRGRYAYYEVLRAGTPVPPLSALLADASRIDLGLRFQRPEHSDCLPEGSG
jgi:hypothetical protein